MDWAGREPPVGVFSSDLIAARSSALADAARRLLRGTAAIALGLAWSAGAGAQSLTWSPSGQGSGGNGNWNSSSWYNGLSGPLPWTSGADAIFGGSAGTVNVNGATSAHNLTFNTSGYTVSGGSTLTLTGASPAIDVGSGLGAIIGSVVAGTAGLTKAGDGALTLSGANTYTNGTTINAGTLQIGAGGTTGSVAGNIVDNSALVFNRSNALTYAGVISGTGSLTRPEPEPRSSPAPTPIPGSRRSAPARCRSAVAPPGRSSATSSTTVRWCSTAPAR